MTTRRTTDALVIGGGMTGAGVLRDLAMRGIPAILVERGDLTSGTTGRYHGLLHSGGRYVTKDPVSARDCARENAVLRRIIPHCLEDTGGYFVVTPWDDPGYADRFVEGCRATGVPCEEVSPTEALRREPLLHPGISRAFAVPDAAADSFLSVETNIRSAREYGGEALTYHRVLSLLRDGDGSVRGALVEDRRTGEEIAIEAAVTINAAGAWAGQIGALAGASIAIVPGKGVMIALNHRLVNTVVNRCKPPADGDILVPIRTVCVIGTTDTHASDPDDIAMPADEIAFMLEEGDKLVPGLVQARALRAWSGVRPLYRETAGVADRDISRDFKLLDHRERDGLEGFISIVGGKYTTYRLMAERTVDLAAARLGVTAPCRTADEPTEPAAGKLFWLGESLARVEEERSYGQLVCECELVTRDRVEAAIAGGAANLDDIRRDVRLGMGPCQGGFCVYRAAALLHERRAGRDDAAPAATANLALHDFLEERWRGVSPVLWGDQLRQERLDELIYLGVLAVDRLPRQSPDDGWLVPSVTNIVGGA